MFEVIKTSEIPINKQPGKLTVTFHCIEIHGRFGMQQLSELTDLPPFFYRKGFGIKGR